MRWSVVPFGKHKGKTFPEIILQDPDWFFWALPKLYGKLADEAEELARRARTIKIPNSRRKRLEVEYVGRTERASPAVGSHHNHLKEQQAIIDQVFKS